jgi:two-component system, OmpR family, sensor kinase
MTSSARRHAPLRRRLALVVVATVTVVVAVVTALSTFALRGTLVDQLDQRLLASSDRAQTAQGLRPARPGATAPPPGLAAPGQSVGTLDLVARDGVALTAGYLDESGTFQRLDADQSAVLLAVASDGQPSTVSLGDLGNYRVISFSLPDGRVVVTGLSMSEIGSTVQSYLLIEGGIAVAGALVAALAGAWLVRRELSPLERVAATATVVSEQPLERGAVQLERVPEDDADPITEVGQVGMALNRMLGHVEAALASRHESETRVRQFVADASHELRTPLASIRGYAELVRQLSEGMPDDAARAIGRVESEAHRMTALVEDMLLLARLDAGRDLELEQVDLRVIAVDAISDAHVASPDHTWLLDLGEATDEPDDIPAPSTVLGDDHKLRQVLANLLSNARVHTPAGTTVVLSVRSDGPEVVISVTDDGPGLDPELVTRLFDRFTRGDAARTPKGVERPSTGLGLAIADAVVTAHNGSITATSTPAATTFTVRLPKNPSNLSL